MRIHSVGDRVTQATYGSGTVTESNERHTTIDFDEHGMRKFSTPMVALERSAVPAPPPRTGRSQGKGAAKTASKVARS